MQVAVGSASQQLAASRPAQAARLACLPRIAGQRIAAARQASRSAACAAPRR